MAKKAMIEREKKRERLVAKYAAKRAVIPQGFDCAKKPSRQEPEFQALRLPELPSVSFSISARIR